MSGNEIYYIKELAKNTPILTFMQKLADIDYKTNLSCNVSLEGIEWTLRICFLKKDFIGTQKEIMSKAATYLSKFVADNKIYGSHDLEL